MQLHYASRIFTTFFVLFLLASPATADWPQFRGSGGQGHSDATGLPLSWSETENVTWKVPVEGCGWSSPVVFGNQIWMTTALVTPADPAEAKRKLDALTFAVPSASIAGHVVLKAVGFDRSSGRLIRSVTLFDVADPPQICATNGYSSPTPVVETGRLYCDFGTMGTVCLDTTTGKILWKRCLPIEHQVGPGSSPILYGKLLVLVRDGGDLQYVAALDKQTGETVWKTDRPPIDTSSPNRKKAFSTPLVIDHAGGPQMIVTGAKWIVSYVPDTGRELWRVDTGASFSNSSRPVFGNGLVFAGTSFSSAQLFAIRPDGQGNVTDTHVAWTTRKQVPSLPSPLLVGKELYLISDGGVATCMDPMSGKVHWAERLLGKCTASPIHTAGRIYFFGEDGRAAVIRPGPQLAKLAESKVDGRVMASAAVADGAFFLRTDAYLYRIEEK